MKYTYTGHAEDDLMVDTARALALWLHRDHVDKQGEPYFGHLSRVAGRVKRWGGSPEQVAAAWLHDAVEDATLTEGAATAIFGDAVGLTVAWLTRNDAGEGYGDWIFNMISERSARPALLVKLADLQDNLARLAGLAEDDRNRLGPRYRDARAKILEALGDDAPAELREAAS